MCSQERWVLFTVSTYLRSCILSVRYSPPGRCGISEWFLMLTTREKHKVKLIKDKNEPRSAWFGAEVDLKWSDLFPHSVNLGLSHTHKTSNADNQLFMRVAETMHHCTDWFGRCNSRPFSYLKRLPSWAQQLQLKSRRVKKGNSGLRPSSLEHQAEFTAPSELHTIIFKRPLKASYCQEQSLHRLVGPWM